MPQLHQTVPLPPSAQISTDTSTQWFDSLERINTFGPSFVEKGIVEFLNAMQWYFERADDPSKIFGPFSNPEECTKARLEYLDHRRP